MLTLNIVTPDRKVAGPIKVPYVTLPGADGEMTILPGHARLLSTVDTGIVTFEMEDGRKNGGAVSTGYVEVNNDKVTLIAETLELSHEIDVSRAQKAKDRAEDKLRLGELLSEDDASKWNRKLLRAMARLSAANLLPPPPGQQR